MIIDAHDIERETTIASDICIIGGGAAGITIARDFLQAGTTISVLAGGGLGPDGTTQLLSDGESVGGRYFPPVAAAVRCLGGNTTHWGSWCRRFEPLDFEQRDWVPSSGWPYGAEELEPYYRRAHGILKLGNETFDPSEAAKEAKDPEFHPVELKSRELETKVWRFHKPPVCFGRDHQDELSPSENVKIYLHANVVDIELSESGADVSRVVSSTMEGAKIYFTAKIFVLAAGGIQNPRILLAANKQQKTGIGNANDVVGRYFQDHPHLHHNGIIVLSNIKDYPYLYDTNSQYDKLLVGGFCPTREFQTSRRILNCAVNFKPSHRSVASAGAAQGWGESIGALWDDLLSMPGKAYRRTRKAFGLKNTSAPERQYLDVITRCEQSPNRESRIMLGNDRDALGVPKVKIDWRVTGLERRTMLEVHRKLAEAIGAISFGRFKVELLPGSFADGDEWTTSGEEGRFEGGWHHMGATRISTDPKTGVVDPDCRIHGMDNFYIAGSSVFPTSSAFNPTMTIVAMSLRLSAHLKARLASRA